MRLARVCVAVVEFGHVAPAEQRAQRPEASGALRDGDREDRLAMLAQLGALGDEAQPVEIHVRAGCHHHQRAPLGAAPRDPALGAGERQRARGLEHRARVLEDVLDRGADLVGIDQHHLVDVLAREAQRLAADLAHGDAVGEQVHVRQRDAPARRERACHRVAVLGLDADHARARRYALHVGRDAGDQAPSAHRHEDRVDRSRMLAQDLQADGALPRDHERIVVRMHEGGLAPACERARVQVGLVIAVAVQHHRGSARRHRRHLDARRGERHDDSGARVEALRGKGDALRVVAGAGADHAARERLGRKVRHLVVGPAQLEREHRLLVLALEQHVVAGAPRDRGRQLQRALDRHVVHLGGEDLLEVIGLLHRSRLSGPASIAS